MVHRRKNRKVNYKNGVFNILLWFCLILLGGINCKKNYSNNALKALILKDYFKNNSRFTLFNQALIRTHIDALLASDTTYTVFAPNDSAMTNAGFTSANINQTDMGQLTKTILYHIVLSEIQSTDLQLFQQVPINMQDSNQLAYLEYNNSGIFINGSQVISANLKASNGIVQEIGKVLLPPIGTMRYTISHIPSLSYFNADLGYSSFDFTFINQITLPQTCLAPGNMAYHAIGINDSISLRYINRPVSVYLQGYFNAKAGQYFTSDFRGTFVYNYVDYNHINQTSAVLKDNYKGFLASLDPTSNLVHVSFIPFHIVQGDIICTNGVIHIIDRFLTK